MLIATPTPPGHPAFVMLIWLLSPVEQTFAALAPEVTQHPWMLLHAVYTGAELTAEAAERRQRNQLKRRIVYGMSVREEDICSLPDSFNSGEARPRAKKEAVDREVRTLWPQAASTL